MKVKDIARLVAIGLIETGVEGGFDNVCKSTAIDSICIGVSSWEGGRAQELLRRIPGTEEYQDRPFSDFSDGEIDALAEILASDEGVAAQTDMLAQDCEEYVEEVQSAGVHNVRAVVYAAMWCPTSIVCVCRCIEDAIDDEYDVEDVKELAEYFYDNYPRIADCEEYSAGYRNRSNIMCIYAETMEVQDE